MRLRRLALGVAIVTTVSAAVATAQAEDGIYVPLMSYRTGPYSGAGAAIFNGMLDYLHMLDARDGGVGGARLIVEECETGYDTKKGVECYDFDERQKPRSQYTLFDRDHASIDPQGGSRQDPDFVDGLWPLRLGRRQQFSGVQSARDVLGRRVCLRKARRRSRRRFRQAQGQDHRPCPSRTPYGKEPIPLLEALAKDYGFTLKLYPVPGAQMQSQTSLWLDVRRDQPDWIYLQGWGAMNPMALKEASKIGFPMNRLVGVWWAGGEDDVPTAASWPKATLR